MIYILFNFLNEDLKSDQTYRLASDISGPLVGNTIFDQSDVVGAAPTTSLFSTQHMASMDWARRDEKHLASGIWWPLYYRFDCKICGIVTPYRDIDLGHHLLR